MNFILSDYIDKTMQMAVYGKLEDGSFSGRVPLYKGVITFADTLHRCEEELKSTLEDWIFVGLTLGHEVSVNSEQ